MRIEDSASPRPFSSTIHASMWDGRSLSSGFAPILAPMMCVRAIVPYRFFVVAFRSDASSDESIHSAVNSPRGILRSLAGRLARIRARTSAACLVPLWRCCRRRCAGGSTRPHPCGGYEPASGRRLAGRDSSPRCSPAVSWYSQQPTPAWKANPPSLDDDHQSHDQLLERPAAAECITVRGIGRGQLMFTADAGTSNEVPTANYGKSTSGSAKRLGRLVDRVELINIGAQIRAAPDECDRSSRIQARPKRTARTHLIG